MSNKHFIITFITVIGSLCSVLSQLLLINSFGFSQDLDLYYFCMSWPIFTAAFFNSVLNYRLSSLINYIISESTLKSLLIKILIFSIPVSLVGFLFSIAIVYYFELTVIMYNNILLMVSIGWLFCFIQIINGAILAVNFSLNKFYTFNILNQITNLFICSYLFIFNGNKIELVQSMFILSALISSAVGLYSIRVYIISPGKNFSRGVFSVKSSIQIALATTCFTSYSLIDSIWGLKGGAGVLSQISLSHRVIVTLGSIAIASPISIYLPKISNSLYKKDSKSLNNYIYHSLTSTLILGIIFSLFSILILSTLDSLNFRDFIILERLSEIKYPIIVMLPGMIFMVIYVVQSRIFFLNENFNNIAVAIGLSWSLFYYFLSSKLYYLGSLGLALSYSFSWAIISIAGIFFIKSFATRSTHY